MVITTNIQSQLFQYVDMKWSIIPINRGTKIPCVKWRPYERVRATKWQIKQWLRQFPGCDWGVVTGRVSGIIVFDIDPKNGGDVTKYDFQTRKARTGSSSEHYYFKYQLHICTSHSKECGEDIQSDGGYVRIVPTANLVWVQEFDLLPFPEELKNRSGKQTREFQQVTSQTVIKCGKRHDFLLSRAGFLQRRGYTEKAITTALLEDYERYCEKRNDDDIEHHVKNVIVRSLNGYGSPDAPVDSLEVVKSDVEDYRKYCMNRRNITLDFPTGFKTFDKNVAYLKRQAIHTIAGDTTIGKTSYALNLVINLLKFHRSVLMFSTEMTRNDIYDRLIAMTKTISGQRFIHNTFTDLEKQQIQDAIDTLSERSFKVIDSFEPDFQSLQKHFLTFRPDCVIFDYIQHLKGTTERYRLLIGNFVKDMKGLARQYNIPIILISQLKRPASYVDWNTKELKFTRPTIHDLKESAVIEQESDMVTLLSPTGKNIDKNVPLLDIELAKNRYGPQLTAQMAFHKEFYQFREV